MGKLHSEQVKAELTSTPAWTSANNSISRTFTFKDFPEAIDFVDKLAVQAEKANHHPDIDIRWNKVKLTLSTHDAGGITSKDFALAREADKLV